VGWVHPRRQDPREKLSGPTVARADPVVAPCPTPGCASPRATIGWGSPLALLSPWPERPSRVGRRGARCLSGSPHADNRNAPITPDGANPIGRGERGGFWPGGLFGDGKALAFSRILLSRVFVRPTAHRAHGYAAGRGPELNSLLAWTLQKPRAWGALDGGRHATMDEGPNDHPLSWREKQDWTAPLRTAARQMTPLRRVGGAGGLRIGRPGDLACLELTTVASAVSSIARWPAAFLKLACSSKIPVSSWHIPSTKPNQHAEYLPSVRFTFPGGDDVLLGFFLPRPMPAH
jgi:hypothetical protein